MKLKLHPSQFCLSCGETFFVGGQFACDLKMMVLDIFASGVSPLQIRLTVSCSKSAVRTLIQHKRLAPECPGEGNMGELHGTVGMRIPHVRMYIFPARAFSCVRHAPNNSVCPPGSILADFQQ